jgi:hypothetical protein
MEKIFFYEFSGNVYLEAIDQTEAEKLVTGKSLNDYLIDEDVYEIDEDYIALDLKKRQEQMGTHFHPLDDSEQYEAFKMRECRYNPIFNDFLNGKFNKDELLKRMVDAENEKIGDCDLIYEIAMVDLNTQEGKTAKLIAVD